MARSTWDKIITSAAASLMVILIVGSIAFLRNASAQDERVVQHSREISELKPIVRANEIAVREQKVMLEYIVKSTDKINQKLDQIQEK